MARREKFGVSGETYIDDCWVEDGILMVRGDVLPELMSVKMPEDFNNYSAVITIKWDAVVEYTPATWESPEEYSQDSIEMDDIYVALCPTPKEAVEYVQTSSCEATHELPAAIKAKLWQRYKGECESDLAHGKGQ